MTSAPRARGDQEPCFDRVASSRYSWTRLPRSSRPRSSRPRTSRPRTSRRSTKPGTLLLDIPLDERCGGEEEHQRSRSSARTSALDPPDGAGTGSVGSRAISWFGSREPFARRRRRKSHGPRTTPRGCRDRRALVHRTGGVCLDRWRRLGCPRVDRPRVGCPGQRDPATSSIARRLYDRDACSHRCAWGTDLLGRSLASRHGRQRTAPQRRARVSPGERDRDCVGGHGRAWRQCQHGSRWDAASSACASPADAGPGRAARLAQRCPVRAGRAARPHARRPEQLV